MNTHLNRYPLVVVGAGASGLYLVQRLGDRRDVLLLESGPSKGFVARDARNAIHTAGPYANGECGRARGFGGTTNLWGGQLLPFSPHDLSPAKGWPLSWKDLSSHYQAVSQLLLNEPSNYGSEAAARYGWPLAVVMDSAFDIHISKWLANPRFRETIARPWPPRVALHCDTTLQSIEPTPEGRYLLHCVSSDGQHSALVAQAVVLATGTLETLRLLLTSRQRHGLPVANPLGFGFMDHVSVDLCTLLPHSRWRMQRWFNTRRRPSGTRYSVRMSSSAGWLNGGQRLNASAMILVRPPRQLWQWLVNAAVAAITSLWQGFVFKPFGPLVLNCMVEQRADMQGRQVSLAADDLPWIEWMPQRSEAEDALALGERVIEALWREGWLAVRPVLPSADAVLAALEDVCHPMGGAAMHVDSSRAVVDADCQLLYCPGIWIASAAVFPSGSHSNPTMTLLALVDRLAEHLLSLNH